MHDDNRFKLKDAIVLIIMFAAIAAVFYFGGFHTYKGI